MSPADEAEAFAAMREIDADLALGDLTTNQRAALLARRKRLRSIYGEPEPEPQSAVGSRQSANDQLPSPSPSPLAGEGWGEGGVRLPAPSPAHPELVEGQELVEGAGEGWGEGAPEAPPPSPRELWSMLAQTNADLKRDDLEPDRRRALNNQLNRIARRLGIAA